MKLLNFKKTKVEWKLQLVISRPTIRVSKRAVLTHFFRLRTFVSTFAMKMLAQGYCHFSSPDSSVSSLNIYIFSIELEGVFLQD